MFAATRPGAQATEDRLEVVERLIRALEFPGLK